MVGPRRLEPEWLDELPPNDPRAIGSRRDLRRINRLMLHAGFIAAALARHGGGSKPDALVDLGAGDGTFALRVARRLAPHWRGTRIVLVDRQALLAGETRSAFEALGWTVECIAADVLDVLARPVQAAAIMANLFLHHLPEDRLRALLARVAAATDLFVACEPRRAAPGLLGSRLLWALGCNDVSRHDAVASVRAGFRRNELSALWPNDAGWTLEERPALLFTHAFLARRVSVDRHAA